MGGNASLFLTKKGRKFFRHLIQNRLFYIFGLSSRSPIIAFIVGYPAFLFSDAVAEYVNEYLEHFIKTVVRCLNLETIASWIEAFAENMSLWIPPAFFLSLFLIISIRWRANAISAAPLTGEFNRENLFTYSSVNIEEIEESN